MKMTDQTRKKLITFTILAIGIYVVAIPVLTKVVEVVKTLFAK